MEWDVERKELVKGPMKNGGHIECIIGNINRDIGNIKS